MHLNRSQYGLKINHIGVFFYYRPQFKGIQCFMYLLLQIIYNVIHLALKYEVSGLYNSKQWVSELP